MRGGGPAGRECQRRARGRATPAGGSAALSSQGPTVRRPGRQSSTCEPKAYRPAAPHRHVHIQFLHAREGAALPWHAAHHQQPPHFRGWRRRRRPQRGGRGGGDVSGGEGAGRREGRRGGGRPHGRQWQPVAASRHAAPFPDVPPPPPQRSHQGGSGRHQGRGQATRGRWPARAIAGAAGAGRPVAGASPVQPGGPRGGGGGGKRRAGGAGWRGWRCRADPRALGGRGRAVPSAPPITQLRLPLFFRRAPWSRTLPWRCWSTWLRRAAAAAADSQRPPNSTAAAVCFCI